MLRIETSDTQPLVVQQQLTRPSVYLDHWAIRRLSERASDRDVFISCIQERSGSVAVSWINLVEFTRVSDHKQQQAAGVLFNALYPNIFFIQVDIATVLEREDEILGGGPQGSPHADMDLLRAFYLQKQTSARPYNAEQMFQEAARFNSAGTLDNYARNVMEQFEKIRGYVRNGEAKDINKPTKTEQISVGTRYILAEVHRQLLMDVDVPFGKNDAIDLLHMVVPAAYCDYVLLDKRWCTILDRAARKLRTTTPRFPIAKAFSGKEGSVQEFLLKLGAKVN